MNKFQRILSIAAGFALLILLLVGDLIGVFSDEETGYVGIDEPHGSVFEADLIFTGDFSEVGPLKTIETTASAKNIGDYDMYVFLDVEMGLFNDAPAATFEADPHWVLLKQETREDCEYYAYGYGTDTELTVLKPDEEAIPLFTKVTFADVDKTMNAGLRVVVKAGQTVLSSKLKTPLEIYEFLR